MTLYHINSKGEKAVCGAKRRKCRYNASGHTTSSAVTATAQPAAQPYQSDVYEARRPVTAYQYTPEQLLGTKDVEEIVTGSFNGWDAFSDEGAYSREFNPVYYKDEKFDFVHVKTQKDGGWASKVNIVFTINGQLWRKEGYYSSYNGGDYEYGNLSRVREVRTELNKYEAVGSYDSNPPVKNAVESSRMSWHGLSKAAPGEQYSFTNDNDETFNVEVVENIRGENGSGTCAIIFTANGELWKKEGYYSSYDEDDYSFGMLEKVEKQEVYDTDYEDI